MDRAVERALAEGIGRCVPDEVCSVSGWIAGLQDELHPQEREAIAAAGPPRQAGFRAGRSAARRALAGLGCPDQAIPMAEDRRPIWPRGFVGSISHSPVLCASIAGRSRNYAGLGIDLERSTPLHPDLIDQVCLPSELGPGEHCTVRGNIGVHRPKLLFVVKEAVFKAYYPQTGYFLDFQELTVSLHAPSGSFIARLTTEVCPSLARQRAFTGRFDVVADHIFAVVGIPSSEGARG